MESKIEISFLGVNQIFYGDINDEYFTNLQIHSAQNQVLQAVLEFMSRANEKNVSILDVGANIGVTGRMMRSYLPDAKLILIEPSPKAFRFLTKNIDSKNTEIINAAVGAEEGVMQFIESEFLAGSYLTNEKNVGFEVPVNTIDDLIHKRGLGNVRLIKIDVEGFERNVLLGCRELIKKNSATFVMEFNSYAIASNGLESPFRLLKEVVSTFGHFWSCRDGQWKKISTDKECRDYFYANMCMYGCVEDVVFGGWFNPDNK